MRMSKQIRAWFGYPNDPDGARFEFAHLSPGQVQDILDASHTDKMEMRQDEQSGDWKPVAVHQYDKGLDREMTIDASITGWENVLDEDGNPMPCTKENKIKIARTVKGFLEFFSTSRDALRKQVEADQEADAKNSQPTPSGSPA